MRPKQQLIQQKVKYADMPTTYSSPLCHWPAGQLGAAHRGGTGMSVVYSERLSSVCGLRRRVHCRESAMANKVDGTVTGPINKESLNMAGHHYSGHTEIYAQLTGTKDCSVIFTTPNGSLSGFDASYIARKAVGLPQDDIPDLPDNLPSIIANGPDPFVTIASLTGVRPGRRTISEVMPTISCLRHQS